MEIDKHIFGALPTGTLDEESVHHIRKGTKQLRARLQLLRHLEGQHQETEKLRAAVKELARMLAAQRDADVMSGVLEELLGEATNVDVQRLLVELRDSLSIDPLPANDMKRIRRLVRDIERNTHKLLGRTHPEAEINQVLESRLAALCAAGAELLAGTDWEALHDWRKQVKKLMYQYQLKPSLTPKDLYVFEHLEQLGSGLGSINDMSILDDYVNTHQAQATRAHDLETYGKVHALIDARRMGHLEHCRTVFRAIRNLQ